MNAPSSNRLIGVLVFLLFCYLGLFTWNARTGYLDTVAERSGLELVGFILSPVVLLKDTLVDYWERYLALVAVADENQRLREELRAARLSAILTDEDRAELKRLRRLLHLEPLRERPGFAARVIAKRFGPLAALKTFTINKGFLDGAIAGTPVISEDGVVGRVLRAAPHAATVIMLTDPGFRLAVIAQDSRTPGILQGAAGSKGVLEVAYVSQTARIAPGDLLITAGVDGLFPKGMPVGVVIEVTPGNETLFQRVLAMPMADLDSLEEVVLLHREGSGPPLFEHTPKLVEPGSLLNEIFPEPSTKNNSSENIDGPPPPERQDPANP